MVRFLAVAVLITLLAGCHPLHRSSAELTIMQTEAPRSMDPAELF